MNIAIFIDSEDIALAISELLTANNIANKVVYKCDTVDFNIFDILILSEDRTVNSEIKKIVLTYNDSFADKDGYILRPFKSAELMRKIKEI